MHWNTRVITLLFVLCLSAAPVLAQGLTVGVKVGAVSSKMSLEGTIEGEEFDFDEIIDNRSGIMGGVFLAVQATSLFGVQVEALYVEKGTAFDVEFEGETFRGNVKLTYAEVPVLLRAALPTGLIRPFVFAGPSLAMEIGCDVEANAEGEETTGDCDELAGEGEGDEVGRRKFDIGATAGAGIEVAAGRFSLLFDGRYTRGLQSLDETDETDVKNETITFTAGIGIPLGN